MKKILIIEDDVGISHSLKMYLENFEFEIELYHTGKNALEYIETVSPDLIILDINLPEQSGIEICEEYRKNSSTPIVMLTARSSEIDKITGLETGADDYIAKPFSPRELLARINTILRRSQSQDQHSILEFQDIALDLDTKTVQVGGEHISLTGNEYEILKKIFESKGKIVSRDTIMKEIIGYENYVYDRTIDTHVKNLRKKLGDREVILTIRGEGYRLNQ
ncbi:response regulator transcription factor [Candidatus Gracilibacteria bacterium]|nr:response regulator transcription factor [Candidatus Gracilibacteria bacterium]